jgi:hypothetical protein
VRLFACNYTAIQRFVLGDNAVCGELLHRAIPTAFSYFSSERRRLDTLVQCRSSCGYVAERRQRIPIADNFRNAADAEATTGFP